MSGSLDYKVGISDAQYDPARCSLFIRGWVVRPSKLRALRLVGGDGAILIPSIEVNISRMDVRKQFECDELPNGFEQHATVSLNGNANLVKLELIPTDESIKPIVVDVPLKIATAFRAQSVYDTESKFLKITGAAFPDTPQRRLRVVLGDGRSEVVEQTFLPTPNDAFETGGVVNHFAGFDATVKHIGQGALSSVHVVADLIDGGQVSWPVDRATILFDQATADVTSVHLDYLSDRLLVEGWYRSYEPVTGLELEVFGRRCFAIPNVHEDDGLTKKLGYRGPKVHRFKYDTQLSVALETAETESVLAAGGDGEVLVSLWNQRKRLGSAAAEASRVQVQTAHTSLVIFDQRTSRLMIWGHCAPGQPPEEVAFFVGNRQVGGSFKPVLPDLEPTAQITTWFVAEEVNFELHSHHKFHVRIQRRGNGGEEVLKSPPALIVSADEVVSSPKKAIAVELLHRHNTRTRTLEAPIACFVFQGSATAVGGGITRMTSMMRAFKEAGYSVVLLDRTAPWEVGTSMPSYRELRRYCDEHLMIPQFYKSGLLETCLKQLQDQKNLSDHETVLLQYLIETTRNGRTSRDGNSGLHRRIDSQFISVSGSVLRALKPDVVISQFAWSCEIHKVLPPGTLGFIDTHDIQSIRYERFAAAREQFGEAAVPNLERFAVDRRTERRFLSMANACIAISPEERLALNDIVGPRKAVLATPSRLQSPMLGSPRTSTSVLFVGNSYDPNNHGIRMFVENIWPLVQKRMSSPATLEVVGSCGEVLRDWMDDQILVHGPVPDLKPYYEQAAIVINPTRFGTGMPVKVVEALSMGKAVVTTSVGLRGLEATESRGAVSVADDAERFAAEIVRLLTDADARARMEQAAYEYANTYLCDEVVYSNLFNFIESKLFY